MDKDYETAMLSINQGNISLAIPLLEQSLNYGNIDSAYQLGRIYYYHYNELGLDRPFYTMAIKYLEMASKEDNKEAQKILGLIYLNKESGHRKLAKGVKLILLSNKYGSKKCKETIKKVLQIIYESVDEYSGESLRKRISIFNDYIKLTRDKELLTPIYTYRNILINHYASLIIDNAVSENELKENFLFFTKYIDKDFFNINKTRYLQKRISLFLESCKDVSSAKQYIDTQENKNSYLREYFYLIYIWIARSYINGENGVKKNFDTALFYYDKVGNYLYNNEIDGQIKKYCEKLLSNKKIDKIAKYLKYVKTLSVKLYIERLIKEQEDVNRFHEIQNRLEIQEDAALKLELANMYEKGIGTPINLTKALELHQELFKFNFVKQSFDYIFDHYNQKSKLEDLKKILIYAKKNNIEFGDIQAQKYHEIVLYYDTHNYYNMCAKSLNSVDTKSNYIYYLFDYYKKTIKDENPNNKYIKENYESFMDVKKGIYSKNNKIVNFPVAIYHFLQLFTGSWIICTVPGHEKTNNYNNGVYNVLKQVYLKNNFIIRNTLIQRKYTVEKKSTSKENRIKDYRIDMQSLAIEDGFNVAEKCIIVVDDITTTGSTLIACRNILLNQGAKKVVLLALGKTKENDYGRW